MSDGKEESHRKVGIRWTSLRGWIFIGGLLFAFGALIPSAAAYFKISAGWFASICLVGLALMIAGVLTVVASLLPLKRLRGRLDPVRRGSEQQVHGSYPQEVQPLVDDLNTLLRRNREALRRSKVEADNLAHGLKTPLAILSNEIQRLNEGAESSTEEMNRQVLAMTAHVEVHLSRARAAAARSAQPPEAAVAIGPVVDGLLRTMKRLYESRGLVISAAVEEGATLRMDSQDLAEMLGNILDNACKWAARQVEIQVRADSGGVSIAVDDDGPGLREAERSALVRGTSVEGPAYESGGSGMGLSIVRTLVELYEGAMTARVSHLGGLAVVLDFPPPKSPIGSTASS